MWGLCAGASWGLVLGLLTILLNSLLENVVPSHAFHSVLMTPLYYL